MSAPALHPASEAIRERWRAEGYPAGGCKWWGACGHGRHCGRKTGTPTPEWFTPAYRPETQPRDDCSTSTCPVDDWTPDEWAIARLYGHVEGTGMQLASGGVADLDNWTAEAFACFRNELQRAQEFRMKQDLERDRRRHG